MVGISRGCDHGVNVVSRVSVSLDLPRQDSYVLMPVPLFPFGFFALEAPVESHSPPEHEAELPVPGQRGEIVGVVSSRSHPEFVAGLGLAELLVECDCVHGIFPACPVSRRRTFLRHPVDRSLRGRPDKRKRCERRSESKNSQAFFHLNCPLRG